LIQRLKAKGASHDVASEIVARLEADGFVRDEQVADDAVRIQASKLIGRREIVRRLSTRGLDTEMVKSELDEQFDADAELDAARQFAAKKLKLINNLPLSTQSRRIGASLDRRGFPSRVIHQVLRELDLE
jgi:SOS response regulatory protein OraA/RecX